MITNFDLVHHLLLYRCSPSMTEPFEAECYTGVDGECMETVAVWGVGGGVSLTYDWGFKAFLMWGEKKTLLISMNEPLTVASRLRQWVKIKNWITLILKRIIQTGFPNRFSWLIKRSASKEFLFFSFYQQWDLNCLKGSLDAKLTFTCCLNINVCWQCVCTTTI